MNTARDWLVTMKTSDRAEQLRPEFETWLQQDPSHHFEYERAEIQWAALNKSVTLLRRAGPMPPECLLAEIAEVAHRTRRRSDMRRQALKGLIGLVSTLGLGTLISFMPRLLSPPAASIPWVHYVGDYGSPKPYVLNDGSELYLNGTNAAASVRITHTSREVALDRGELLVRVKHDADRPFLVEAGETIVRAIGTLFSVRREATGVVEAVVKEGTVTIDPAGLSAEPGSPERTRALEAGQTATISDGKVSVEDNDPAEIARSLAWVRGQLYLRGTLKQAVSQFNDHNKRKLLIGDRSLESLNVTGLYNCHELEEFLDSLRSRGVGYKVKKSPGSESDVFVLLPDSHPARQ
jgi:transmembrane sensor